jgi:hypothetical protein
MLHSIGVSMKKTNSRLLIYASSLSLKEKKAQAIKVATERVADLLKLPYEMITFEEPLKQTYVYYQKENEETIPLFCEVTGRSDIEKIFRKIMKMLLVLSFHPRFSGLKPVRKEFMLFS